MPAILEELQAGLMACESGEPSKEFYSVEERVVRWFVGLKGSYT